MLMASASAYVCCDAELSVSCAMLSVAIVCSKCLLSIVTICCPCCRARGGVRTSVPASAVLRMVGFLQDWSAELCYDVKLEVEPGVLYDALLLQLSLTLVHDMRQCVGSSSRTLMLSPCIHVICCPLTRPTNQPSLEPTKQTTKPNNQTKQQTKQQEGTRCWLRRLATCKEG